MLQKIRRHKPFHSRKSLQTKGVLAFSGPHLGCTKPRPKKSSVHPNFLDSFAFLLDVFCNIEVDIAVSIAIAIRLDARFIRTTSYVPFSCSKPVLL